MKGIRLFTIALAAAAMVSCGRAGADHNASETTASKGTDRNNNTVSRGDKEFIQDMAMANMAEIQLAQLVPDRSTDPEVKKFAQMMINDHTNSLTGIRNIAGQFNVQMPAQVDGKYARLHDKLAKWHGDQFDREYMDAMVDSHEDVLDALDDRVDEQKLAEYKATSADRTSGRKTTERAEAVQITPEQSDNPATMRLNEWAAQTYPVVQAHLDEANILKDAADKRANNKK